MLQLSERASNAETQVVSVQRQLSDIYRSRSWRLTAPLRWVLLQFRLLKEYGLVSRVKALGHKAMNFFSSCMANFIRTRPNAAKRLILISHRIGIHRQLKSIYTAANYSSYPDSPVGIEHVQTNEIPLVIFGKEVISIGEWRVRAEKATQALPSPAPLASLRRELLREEDRRDKEQNSLRAPRASIIASLYRPSEFLDSYLGNLLEQTIFAECEFCLVLVDPTPEELDLASSFARSYSNVKLEVIPELIGIYKAWNIAVAMSSAPYLTNANADDLRRRDSLELQVKVLDQFNWVDVVYQDFYYSYDSTMAWEHVAAINARCELPHVLPLSLLAGVNAPHNAPMWRKSLHTELGMFDEVLQSASDYDFWLRCADAGKQFFKIRDPHVAYFLNPNGLSTRPDGPGSSEPGIVQARYSHFSKNFFTPDYVSTDKKLMGSYELAERVTIGALETLRRMRGQSNG